jgi:hypothetical protein
MIVPQTSLQAQSYNTYNTTNQNLPQQNIPTNISSVNTPPSSSNNAGESSNNIKRSRLKSNLLDIVSKQVAEQAKQEVKIIELNEVVAQQLYQDFIVHLNDVLQKTTAAQQLKLARVSFEAPNTITIWCATEINKVMVNTQKDVFFDFVKTETKQTDVRVQIEIDKNAIIEEPVVERKRSKIDIFEEMVKKEPLLLQLKQQLNLILE